ncbi:MAG: peptidylprolyl isomerase [bacterium]
MTINRLKILIYDFVLTPNFVKKLFYIILFPIAAYSQPLKDTLVAGFGQYNISFKEYRLAYLNILKQPNIFDSRELRENILDELIYGRLLAEEGRKANIDTSELIQYKMKAFREKCLREEHYRAVIKPKIAVSEQEVEEVYLFTQEERRISHLFAPDKKSIDSLYNLLLSGRSFEELAGKTFKDTALANSGGDLGWVNWDQLEYDFGMTAFRQPMNSYSAPVKTSFGYHILSVTDYKKKPLITRTEYEMARQRTKYLLEYKIGEKLSFEYIDSMLKKAAIVIYPEVLEFIDKALTNKFTRKPNQFNQMYDLQLKDDEVEYVESNLWDERNRVMATINGENYTVGDFIGAMNYIPYDIIYSNFRGTLSHAFRDFIITKEALSLGLDKNEDVFAKQNIFGDYLLQLPVRKKIIDGVQLNDEEMRTYFEQNKTTFKESTFEQAYDFIKKTLLNEKKQKAISGYIAGLIRDMKIVKHTDIIHNYYDSILNKNPDGNVE